MNRIDPDGRDWVKLNSCWTWNDNITSLKQAQAAGYTDYRTRGAIIDNAMINGNYGSNGMTSVYLGNSGTGVTFTYPNSTVTPFQVGTEWLSGDGPRHRDFTNGDTFTEMLRQHDHVQATMTSIVGEIANGAGVGATGNAPYDLSGIEGVGKYIKDYSTLATFGQTGNLAVTYLGSYDLQWSILGIENGTATIQFTVNNSSTMQSASRPPVVGYWDIWKNTVGKAINNAFSSGAGSTTTQTFIWTETIPIQQ